MIIVDNIDKNGKCSDDDENNFVNNENKQTINHKKKL
jgi:hypothetical protein